MFTGIIEELGTVSKLNSLKDSARLSLSADVVLQGTKLGDSIAVNGVCLTVAEMSASSFSVDIMYETLHKTNLQELIPTSKVNLERALQLQTRLGGHLVSGHIDGVGKIMAIRTVGIASVYEIKTTSHLASYLLPKGSVAIDGISLTVIDVASDFFSVSLIPHTSKNTTLGFKAIGSTVNLETDLIGKYVARFLRQEKDSAKRDISLDLLIKHGFIE